MDAIEPRVSRLENSHNLLAQELHQINRTLSKIETAIERQNEIASDIRILRVELENKESRIVDIETNIGRLTWLIISSVVGGVMTLLMGR